MQVRKRKGLGGILAHCCGCDTAGGQTMVTALSAATARGRALIRRSRWGSQFAVLIAADIVLGPVGAGVERTSPAARGRKGSRIQAKVTACRTGRVGYCPSLGINVI